MRWKPHVTVAAVVERDPAMASKVLQMANCAFYRPERPLSSIREAVMRVGLRTLTNCVLAADLFFSMPREDRQTAILLDAIEIRAQRQARLLTLWCEQSPELGIDLREAGGKVVQTARSGPDGSFAFDGVASGSYRVGIDRGTFAKPFGGVGWLGPRLITPAIMISYIWIWAGFAMVVIAAGLAAIPRDVLEAARTDGAREWQVFRRVTVPLLAPVLSVVFVTMLINVLKVFDIIIAIAPGSVQDDASVLALAMWRTSFGGVDDFGTGSAIAVFIFLLVIPVLALNIRRFRSER